MGIAPDRSASAAVLFRWSILAICLSYLTVQILYVLRMPLVMDEFQFAYHVYELKEKIPYRDFGPYKTVLGYYIQLPALLMLQDSWGSMILVKLQMALINTVMLSFIAWRLQRHLSRLAVVIGLALLASMSTFLERSSDLRVDMLTGWVGLISLLFLLERRYFSAGLCAAISFLVSQKGIFFMVAGTAAVSIDWLWTRSRSSVGEPLRFAAGLLIPVTAYLGAFALFAEPSAVIDNTYRIGHRVALQYTPGTLGRIYWTQTLSRNPLFWGLAFLGPILACRRPFSRSNRLLLWYAVAFDALIVWHRQPWPYFFVIPAVVLFVQATVGVDAILEFLRRKGSRSITVASLAVFVVLGLALPLSRLPSNLERSNHFQRSMVYLGEAMIESDETYLAAFALLYKREQFPPEMQWLASDRIERLHAAPISELRDLRDRIVANPPKFILFNYRIHNLPPLLRESLLERYAHFWGNIFPYAPRLQGLGNIYLSYSGRYLVRSRPGTSLLVDGTLYRSGDLIELERGLHRIAGIEDENARLMLVPEGVEEYLDEEMRSMRAFFPNVYQY